MMVELHSGSHDGCIRVFLVDDHPVVRSGVALALNSQVDMIVCGEASSASEALDGIQSASPQVVVVDLMLHKSSGVDLIKDIQAQCPDVLVLVLTMQVDALYAERVLRAGARGYVTKEDPIQNVIDGVRRVVGGKIYLSETINARILGRMVGSDSRLVNSPVENLTDRELQVFEMFGEGLGTREIAQRLHLSVKTVDSHREHIKDKLHISNGTLLLKQAIQWIQWEKRGLRPHSAR